VSALTVASVTAVLRSLLENGLVERDVTTAVGGDVLVSAVAPDRVSTGDEEKPQLNLFLYQVTASTGLRPVQVRPGREPAAAPLALELHYLLTAYGAQDYQTDILLGYALQLFHESPVLGADTIEAAVRALSAHQSGRVVAPALRALGKGGSGALFEQVRIVPQFLDPEALSRLWSAIQAKYRPSVAYRVSVVPVGP
jgi:hypothetical protein